MMDDEPRLTLADAHAMVPRYCNAGCRAMCERLGVEWTEFRDHGVPFSVVENVDDEMMKAVLQKARERLGIA